MLHYIQVSISSVKVKVKCVHAFKIFWINGTFINVCFQRVWVQGNILCLRKRILTYINITRLAEKTSTSWNIIVTESKTEALKDYFLTVGQSGKIIGTKNASGKYCKTCHMNYH